ncbi:hypothetical protein [Bacillus sp. NPDC094106]|uniref:hypothetical protein n=1 Tax=Bacillus sp. NPDC094106 TaxID=3363949 RepID=UPI0037F4B4CA
MKSIIKGKKKLEMCDGEMNFSIYAHVLEKFRWDWTNISVELNDNVIAIGYFENRKVVIEKKINFVASHYVKEKDWMQVDEVSLRFHPTDIVQLLRLLKEEMEEPMNQVETANVIE